MNTQFATRLIVVFAVIAVLLGFMIGFQVRQTEQVVVTRLGQPVRVIAEPGLYAKFPWPIETVNRVDIRLNFYEVRLSEALTRDKRNLIAPAFVAWAVTDPLKFLEAIGSSENAESKIDSLVSSAENTLLGTYDFKQLVSADPNDIKLPEIEAKLTASVNQQAQASYGISIEQVGIERVTLPEANTLSVFERMRAERAQFAEQYLAEGRQQADAIKAQTDTQKTVILAEAQKNAEIKRGEAEAEAARIYNQAQNQGPDLYLLLREIETLKKTLKENTTLVLDAKAPPFFLLKSDSPDPSTSSDHDSKNK
ncbi:MAG TPA: protease modulator HflC [Candidatus Methylacidiphilales bacterium]